MDVAGKIQIDAVQESVIAARRSRLDEALVEQVLDHRVDAAAHARGRDVSGGGGSRGQEQCGKKACLHEISLSPVAPVL
jgi:hypothetical protein